MAIERHSHGGALIQDIQLEVMCHVNRNHLLGTFACILPGSPRRAGIKPDYRFNIDSEHDKAIANCSECAVTGRGRDQQVSLDRVRNRFDELLKQEKRSGKLYL